MIARPQRRTTQMIGEIPTRGQLLLPCVIHAIVCLVGIGCFAAILTCGHGKGSDRKATQSPPHADPIDTGKLNH